MANSDFFLGTHGFQKDTPYKIYISSSGITKSEQSDFFNPNTSSARCIRCGSEMTGFQSVFVTICPPFLQPKSNQSYASSGSVCSKNSTSPFHARKENSMDSEDDASSEGTPISLSCIKTASNGSCPSCKSNNALSCIKIKQSVSYASSTSNQLESFANHDSSDSCASSSTSNQLESFGNHDSSDSCASSNENISLPSSSRHDSSDSLSCKFHTTPRSSNDGSSNASTDLTNDDPSVGPDSQSGHSSVDSVSYVGSQRYRLLPCQRIITRSEISRKYEIITDRSVTPCKDCHIAVDDVIEDGSDGLESVSLVFQISNSSGTMQAFQCEYECPLSSKVDVGANALGVYPEKVVHTESDSSGILPGSIGYVQNLPDLNPAAEAAYQSHLRNLVPCAFCGRTFNPDRVMVHQNACIERSGRRKQKGK